MKKSREFLETLWKRGKEFLGVDFPILGGAMSWLSESGLVSAISNAGGFGVLAGGNMPPDLLRQEIEKTFQLTDRPFGLNLITLAPNFQDHLEHALDIGFPFIILAGGLPPRKAIARIKDKGSKVFCFAPTVGIAQRLITFGVDALIIEEIIYSVVGSGQKIAVDVQRLLCRGGRDGEEQAGGHG